MNGIGEVLHVLRISAGRTQAEVAEHLGITQAAFSRYENDLREPDPDTLARIADAFGVTPEFLAHNFRAVGAVAAHAHMRRQRTARPGDWRRVEARLNILRMHAAYIASRIPLDAENHVPSISSESTTPVRAAQEVRYAWRLPIGPVRSLVRWLESAGVLIIEEALHSPR
ncbi:MAG: helix-turn-helix transcriptional regulator, partial [Actinomyces bouchesdurhonensis]|nr:helix-turn-helix transcriptional regulator [Actinomyces bouchesdurhonensis]